MDAENSGVMQRIATVMRDPDRRIPKTDWDKVKQLVMTSLGKVERARVSTPLLNTALSRSRSRIEESKQRIVVSDQLIEDILRDLCSTRSPRSN
jgi:hypothetical protein